MLFYLYKTVLLFSILFSIALSAMERDILENKQEAEKEIDTEELKGHMETIPAEIREKIISYLIDDESFLALVRKGYFERVQLLIKLNPNLVNVVNDAQLTPLMVATINGHKNVAQYLVSHGAKDTFDLYGITARDIAQEQNDYEILKILDGKK